MQPKKYERVTDFTEQNGDETNHPAINDEFDSAALSINQTRDNLAIIQRDDGQLENGIVTADSLSDSALDFIKEGVSGTVQEAQTAALSASIAATAANSARDTAVLAKQNAETANNSSQLNAVSAANSASSAADSASSAADSASSAFSSATDANQSKNSAASSAAAASDSAENAANASRLSIGTVSGGVVPSATITGGAGSQSLNLVLVKGDKGDKGDTGDQGERGLQGLQGIQGIKGDKGDTGASFDADVKDIFANRNLYGTQTKGFSFLAIDTGELYFKVSSATNDWSPAFTYGKGDKGDKGDTGDQGERGLQGLQGIQGIKGDKGDKGDDGVNGAITSVDVSTKTASLVGKTNITARLVLNGSQLTIALSTS